MALPTLYERADSREFRVDAQGGGITLRFTSVGSQDETEIYLAALAIAPELFDGFIRNGITSKMLGGPVATVEVSYGPTGAGGDGETPVGSGLGQNQEQRQKQGPAEDEPLNGSYSFEVSGKDIHVTQSKVTLAAVGRDGRDAPNFKRAIGVTHDGIEGVGIVAPSCDWSRTVNRPSVTMPYYRTLRRLTGTVNVAPFYGFPAGELLYLGCNGNFTQGEGWSLTHKFAYEPNVEDFSVCDGLLIPFKEGWDYLWVFYEESILPTQIAPLPAAAYVERVYDRESFLGLEIGF